MSLADKIFSEVKGSGVVGFPYDLGVYPRVSQVQIEVSTNGGELTPPENTAWFIKTSHKIGDLFDHLPTITRAIEQVFAEFTEREVLGYKIESTVAEGVITHTVYITSWGQEGSDVLED